MPKKKKYPKRTMGQKLKGVQMRVGGVAAGQHPKSAAPRTFPVGGVPNVKPRGSVQGPKGGTKLNPNLYAPAPKKKKKKR